MWDLNETEDEGIQQDYQSSRHASVLNHQVLNHQRASTASSLSGSGLLIGGGSPNMRKRSNYSSGEGAKSSCGGSLPEINDSESGMIVVCVNFLVSLRST